MPTPEFPKALILFCPTEQTVSIDSSCDFDFEKEATAIIDFIAESDDIDAIEQFALDTMNASYALEWEFIVKHNRPAGSW